MILVSFAGAYLDSNKLIWMGTILVMLACVLVAGFKAWKEQYEDNLKLNGSPKFVGEIAALTLIPALGGNGAIALQAEFTLHNDSTTDSSIKQWTIRAVTKTGRVLSRSALITDVYNKGIDESAKFTRGSVFRLRARPETPPLSTDGQKCDPKLTTITVVDAFNEEHVIRCATLCDIKDYQPPNWI